MKRFFGKRKKLSLREIPRQTRAFFSRLWSGAGDLFRRQTGRIKRRQVMARMQKADIVLASPPTARLSLFALLYRLFLKSRYVHSMLYLGEGQILHTTTRHGVVVGRLPRKVCRKDRYSIFRVRGLSPDQRAQVVAEALKRKDKKLDHAGLITNVPSRMLGLQKALLSWEENRVWCSKLIYQAFYAAGIELVPPEKGGVITSEDLAHLPEVTRV